MLRAVSKTLFRAIPVPRLAHARVLAAASAIEWQADQCRWNSAAAWAAGCLAGAAAVSAPLQGKVAACEAPSPDKDDDDKHAPSERETAIIDRLHRIFRQLDGAYRRAQSGLTRVTPTIKITPEHFILRFEIRRGSYLHGFNNVSTAAIWAVARCHKAVPLSLDINFEHDTFRPAPTRIHATPSKADAEAHISVTIQNATPGQPLTVEFQCSRDPSDAMVDYMLDTMGVAMMGASMLPSRRLHHAYSSEMDAAARQMFKEMQAIIDELFGSPVRSPPRRSHPSDNEPSSTPFADNDALSGSSVARDEAMQRPGTVKHNSGPWPYDSPQGKLLLQKLQRMGAHVYLPERGDDKATEEHGTSRCDWDKLAGYDSQKQVIEDTVLLALQRPEVYAQVAAGTRGKEGASLRPRGVLFEGPPGCGKTTSARVIASQASVPLVYIPLEAILSAYYGESERNLSQLLAACDDLDGCIIFLDELDSLATERSERMYEATRRLLGVLLRFMDGFNAPRSIVIAATNRKHDLDHALLSRFDAGIFFSLPDAVCRQKIFRQYAQQLGEDELQQLAQMTDGFSGRDIQIVCEQVERAWAAKLIREGGEGLPGLHEYTTAAGIRAATMVRHSHMPGMSDV